MKRDNDIMMEVIIRTNYAATAVENYFEAAQGN